MEEAQSFTQMMPSQVADESLRVGTMLPTECLPEKVLLSQHIQTLLEDSQDQGTLETADIM